MQRSQPYYELYLLFAIGRMRSPVRIGGWGGGGKPGTWGGRGAFRPPPSLSPLRYRGGSVSRRDHNQAYRRRTHAAWAPKSEGKRTSLFPATLRERGVWGRGASLRSGLSPTSPPPSFREGARGRGAFLQKAPPSQSHTISFSRAPWRRWPWRIRDACAPSGNSRSWGLEMSPWKACAFAASRRCRRKRASNRGTSPCITAVRRKLLLNLPGQRCRQHAAHAEALTAHKLMAGVKYRRPA